MALSIYEILRQYQQIDQDQLAASFAEHFDRTRGYGLGARHLLIGILKGGSWRQLTREIFGSGSYGNGGAMRVAPVGAYFADDLELAAEQARLSAEITHAHPEGIAGAIAVAVAAAYAWRLDGQKPTRQQWIDLILPHVPEGEVRSKIEQARNLPSNSPIWPDVVEKIGNGSRISAQDSVPLVLWCAGEQLDDYQEAIWLTASAGGDVDTTCAMVGGIVASYAGQEGIPAAWIQYREPLPEWALGQS